MEFYTSVIRHKGAILYRGYKDGERVHERVKFAPHVFLPDPNSNVQALDGKTVRKMDFPSMWEASQYLKEREGISGFEVYGTTDWVSQYLQERHPGSVEFDPDLINIVSVDIEVKSDDGFPEPSEAKHEVDCVTFKSSRSTKYHVFTLYHGATEVEGHLKVRGIEAEDVCITYCENEEELFDQCLRWWIENDPDVMTGWNIRGFDVPYLINRTARLLGEEAVKLWSPWGIVEQRGAVVKGQEMITFDMYGISQLDYLDTFKKFGYSYPTQETYKLDHIANVVLGETKLSYDEFSSLHELSRLNPSKYVAYNVIDTQIVSLLEAKMGLLSLIFIMSYKTGVNYSDCYGTTRIWDTFIYRALADDGIVVQPNRMARKVSYDGGYVKMPIAGLHDWVVSFDFKSLYPNIIAQYNMSSETVVADRIPGLTPEYCLDEKYSPHPEYATAANGSMYRKDKQGIIPRLIETYYDERKAIQKLEKAARRELEERGSDSDLEKKITRLNNEQMAIKILMNSLYGAMANVYFRHYDIRIAEGITQTGQLSVKWVEKAINTYLRKVTKSNEDFVVAMDTDSLYVKLDAIVKMAKPADPVEFLDKFSKEVLGPILDEACNRLHKQMGSYKPRLSMGREVIAARAIWTDKKKRYILRIMDDDGVRLKVPKIKIKGLEAIKASTPAIARQWMKEFFEVLMTKEQDDAHAFIAEKRAEFCTLPLETVAAPRGVSNVEKWRDGDEIAKGTPQNSRAAIVYNNMLKKAGLDRQYSEIRDGDKMRFISLKEPNPARSKIIGFTNFLPPEFGLEKYVDWDGQFEDCFLKPVLPVLKSVGWSDRPKNDFEEFFS